MATVVVAGAVASKLHNGGESWVRASWARGLDRLGCDVFLIEQVDNPSPAQRRYFHEVVEAFGLDAALIDAEGPPPGELVELAEEADLLVNISGHLRVEPLFSRFRRKAYVDLDPGFTQFWHGAGNDAARLAGHDVYFTIGENVGRPGCPIPTDGIHWLPTRQPVVLDDWPPVAPNGDPGRLTTVGSWRGPYGRVEHKGHTYGLKLDEFRKLITLPQRVPQSLELALDIHPAEQLDLRALRQNGWRLTDPAEVAGDPEAFREYVQGSGGEFSVAQGIYVETRSGWFSDRTTRYLASGKPALVQDTGFSEFLPTGDGLVAFTTPEEAAAGAEAIARDYEAHSEAARRIAEAHFASGTVLADFLARAGVR
jgi:hypothetical protein